MRSTLNLGILAHVDAGKTSLTERLLFAAGVIDEIGSVDSGSTQTDTLALERQRGITIKSAVVSFDIAGVTVNLIDTPGHPDFIAEVERVLSVLDGAVLVVSAVEGVQAQTRVLMRALQRLRIPTLMFINKIDRGGADCQRVLDGISAKLTRAVVPMTSVADAGTRAASVTPSGPGDTAFTTRLVDLLAEYDDGFLAAYVADEASASYPRLRAGLAAQTRAARAYPVYCGSAITGAGIDPLVAGIAELLPAAPGDPDAPVSGTVFKVDRGPAGEKLAYARIFSGTVRVRDRVALPAGKAGKVTAIAVFDRGGAAPAGSVSAGRIAKLWGLDAVRIGDQIGAPGPAPARGHQFSPPTLETVVLPRERADRGALHVALTQLAEQDPLINVRRDDQRGEVSVSLYGEVQKEVVEATLATEFGLAVSFRESSTICIERLDGTGAAAGTGKVDHPFLATVGLRVEPAPAGSGVAFGIAVELGSMPLAFFTAVEDTVRETLRQGLYGWAVPDCRVTMTRSGYWPKTSRGHNPFDKSLSSTGWDFRHATPLVLVDALCRAGTSVYEPMHRFHLDAPADTAPALQPVLARAGAVPKVPLVRGSGYELDGEIPAARVHELRQQLHALTRGEGVLECEFDHYERVRGRPPTRPRTDLNPLDRKEYLLRVVRRV